MNENRQIRRDRRALAGLACACALLPLLAGCHDDDEGNASVRGLTFPEATGGAVAVGFARDVEFDRFESVLFATTFTESGVRSNGRFRVHLAERSGALALFLQDATFVEPFAGAPVTLAGEQSLTAMVRVGEAEDVAGVAITPLSEIASVMAVGLGEATGAGTEGVLGGVSRSLSFYFGEDIPRQPFAPGEQLWDTPGPLFGAALTPRVTVGLVVAGLSAIANDLGASVVPLATLIGADGADGVADNVIHFPFSVEPQAVTAFAGVPDYPDDPLGTDLADAIERFLASPRNTAGIDAALAAPLLARLRAGQGRILGGVPLISTVTDAGGGNVAITGSNFVSESKVFFGGIPARSVTFGNFNQITAALPSGFSGGRVFVTVVNPTGLRHSREADLPAAP